jgi:hypothetical protein
MSRASFLLLATLLGEGVAFADSTSVVDDSANDCRETGAKAAGKVTASAGMTRS